MFTTRQSVRRAELLTTVKNAFTHFQCDRRFVRVLIVLMNEELNIEIYNNTNVGTHMPVDCITFTQFDSHIALISMDAKLHNIDLCMILCEMAVFFMLCACCMRSRDHFCIFYLFVLYLQLIYCFVPLSELCFTGYWIVFVRYAFLTMEARPLIVCKCCVRPAPMKHIRMWRWKIGFLCNTCAACIQSRFPSDYTYLDHNWPIRNRWGRCGINIIDKFELFECPQQLCLSME